MFLHVLINAEADKAYDVRELIIKFDQNIMQFHLNNAAQDYVEREIMPTGFPTLDMRISITEQQ